MYKKGSFTRYIIDTHPDPDTLLDTEEPSVHDQMFRLAKGWVDKELTDRLNHLKSELSEQKRPKMDKTIDKQKVALTEAKIEELEKLKERWK